MAHVIPFRAGKYFHSLTAFFRAHCSTANALIEPAAHIATSAHMSNTNHAELPIRFNTASKVANERYSTGFMAYFAALAPMGTKST